jgi:hypothetical protein
MGDPLMMVSLITTKRAQLTKAMDGELATENLKTKTSKRTV